MTEPDEVSEELSERIAALVDRPAARELARSLLAARSARDPAVDGEPVLAAAIGALLQLGGSRPAGTHRLHVVHPRARGGEPERHAFLQVVTDDMPFLIDSLRAALGRREVRIHELAYPLLRAQRDGEGRLLGLSAPARGEAAGSDDRERLLRESWLHLMIDAPPAEAARRELEEDLDRVLLDVRRVVEDWRPMRERAEAAIAELGRAALASVEADESLAFLRWLLDDHFIFLGCRDYRLEGEGESLSLLPVPDSELGLLRPAPDPPVPAPPRVLTPGVRRFFAADRLVRVTKSMRRSTVHRDVPRDRISVKLLDREGRPAGERRFFGLFTSRAYSTPASSIPLLRGKLERVMARAGLPAGGHGARLLRFILEGYPRDELFQLSDDDLLRLAPRLVEVHLRPRPALLVRRDDEERYVTCLVYLPQERYEEALRLRIRDLLESAFASRVTASYSLLSDQPLARLQLTLTPEEGSPDSPDVTELEAQLAELSTPWSELLEEPLGARFGWQAAREIHHRYRDAFPAAYREITSPAEAAADVEIVERVLASRHQLGLRLDRPAGGVDRLQLRIFEGAGPTPLSRVLRRLENMGLLVSADLPFQVRPAGVVEPVWGRRFEAVAEAGIFPESAAGDFEEALCRVWSGEVEDDGFNRLVLAAGLTWRQVVVLRACCRYLRQVGIVFGLGYLADTLVRNAGVARLLVELFEALFDPDRPPGAREETSSRLLDQLRPQIDDVQSLDEDRILRRLLNLVRNTLRTNYFQPAADGGPKPYLSLKLDSTRLLQLPRPRPPFETFVYSPRVEAVHLRAAEAARGGIRWSDRREDFRTEVLGLYKAQMVKNTTIVAVGAKGGFVVRQPPLPPAREALLGEAVECYRTMIRGLLDLTDDLRGGEVVPPPRVVRRDGDDPYLVVAADKGTATFSDVANAVAHEYGYWLGDAFASGGSAGYDHKQMAITARGAWESVKRHFRELGRDVQAEATTVVGVGDMSGDVFGNGMLLSRHLRLVAAFNHLHVFVDPDPDPEASWAERKRLFELPRSSWSDYDAGVISEGGGVFERSAKVLPVSPRMRRLFGLEEDEVAPDRLIQALLRAPVDLLWFGGIGTYVKAGFEAHGEVGDRANDAVRVDAGELRARVIGEGANLALTQAARVEYALRGGRLNTDFLDNSAGVHCSDLEVNVKILLAAAQARGELERAERDPVLAEVAEEVAQRVLRNSYEQAQAVSLAVFRGPALLSEQQRLVRDLEAKGALDRSLERLPDDAGFEARRAALLGVTRPEVALLLAYAKMALNREILASTLPDDPHLEGELAEYFPPTLGGRFRAACREHRLRREIATSRLTCAVTHRMGPTFVFRLAEESGGGGPEVVECFIAARDVLGAEDLWQRVDALDNRLPAAVQAALQLEIMAALETATAWLLRHRPRQRSLGEQVARYGEVAAAVAAGVEEWAPDERRRQRRRAYVRSGVPEELAGPVTALEEVARSFDVALAAERCSRRVAEVAPLVYAVEEGFALHLVPAVKASAVAEGPEQRGMLSEAEDLLHRFRHLIVDRLLAAGDGEAELAALRQAGREAVLQLEELAEAPDPDAALLLALSRRLLDVGTPAAVR